MIRTPRSGKCAKRTNNKNRSPAEFDLSGENLVPSESRQTGAPGEMARATPRWIGRNVYYEVYIIGNLHENNLSVCFQSVFRQCFLLDKSCRKMYTIFSTVLRQQRKSVAMTYFGFSDPPPNIIMICIDIKGEEHHCREEQGI
jgi:hypothetical protein